MTALTQEQVRHIAKLARLNLRDDEVKKFTKELSAILEYISTLEEVETENVEPTLHVTGMTNSLRDDEVNQEVDPEQIIATSPLPIVDQQIQTPSAHG